MSIIKRKNKKFDYEPRYYKGESNPYAIKHKFDEFRSSTGSNTSLKGKINGAISELKGEKNVLKIDDEIYELEPKTNSNKVVLYIIAILVLIFLFIIDFDLSIFSQK